MNQKFKVSGQASRHLLTQVEKEDLPQAPTLGFQMSSQRNSGLRQQGVTTHETRDQDQLKRDKMAHAPRIGVESMNPALHAVRKQFSGIPALMSANVVPLMAAACKPTRVDHMTISSEVLALLHTLPALKQISCTRTTITLQHLNKDIDLRSGEEVREDDRFKRLPNDKRDLG